MFGRSSHVRWLAAGAALSGPSRGPSPLILLCETLSARKVLVMLLTRLLPLTKQAMATCTCTLSICFWSRNTTIKHALQIQHLPLSSLPLSLSLNGAPLSALQASQSCRPPRPRQATTAHTDGLQVASHPTRPRPQHPHHGSPQNTGPSPWGPMTWLNNSLPRCATARPSAKIPICSMSPTTAPGAGPWTWAFTPWAAKSG